MFKKKQQFHITLSNKFNIGKINLKCNDNLIFF